MFFLKRVVAMLVMACSLSCVTVRGQQKNCHNQLYLQVLDGQTLLPIPGALAGIGNQQTQTDADGNVLFNGICPGTLHLHIQATGYRPIGQEVTSKGKDSLRLLLQPMHQTLDDIEISSHKQAIQTTTSVTTIDREALDKLKGKNLAGILSTVAGVNVLQTGATIGKPVVNGMHSNRLLVLNNGIRQEGQQWGSEHAPEIDPFIAQHISVIKGAEAIRYGAEAMGGVIIIEPSPLPRDSSLHAEVNLAGTSNGRSGITSATLSGNIKKVPSLSWRLQGTAKQSGNFQAPGYFMENSGSKELNYSAGLGYTGQHTDIELFYSRFSTELGIFKGAHIGSKDDLMAAIAHGAPFNKGSFYYNIDAPRQYIDHHLLKAKGHVHISDYLHLNVQYGFQKNRRQEYDLRRGGRSSIPSMDFDLLTHTLDASMEYFDGRQWKATVGINGLAQQNTSAANLYTSPLIPDYRSTGAGAYAIGKLLRDVFELEAGVRYDYRYLTALGYKGTELYGGRHTFHNVSGSIGALYRISNQAELKSNLGTAWRPPTVNELYSTGLHHGAAAVEYGDSTLKSEKSIQWINSINYTNNAKWLTVDADIFVHYFDGYIYLMPTGAFTESLRGAFPVFETKSTNALFTGADLSAQVTFLRNFDYALKGSIVRAKDITAQRYLPMIPADKLEHSFTVRYNPFAFLHKSYVQLSHIFVARQTRYEPNSDFAPPPEAYHLFNINLGTQLQHGKHSLLFNFSIENLMNVSYKDYMNRFRYYAHDMGRNFILRLTYRI